MFNTSSSVKHYCVCLFVVVLLLCCVVVVLAFNLLFVVVFQQLSMLAAIPLMRHAPSDQLLETPYSETLCSLFPVREALTLWGSLESTQLLLVIILLWLILLRRAVCIGYLMKMAPSHSNIAFFERHWENNAAFYIIIQGTIISLTCACLNNFCSLCKCNKILTVQGEAL